MIWLADLSQATNKEQLLASLGCDGKTNVKVVSMFGNTGDGKSYTMNQVFFGGQEVGI